MEFSVFKMLLLITMTIVGLRYWKRIRNYIKDQRRIRKYVNKLPSPQTLPLLGNALEVGRADQAVQMLTKMAKDLGAPTYCFWLGMTPKIVITDPEDIQIVSYSPKVNQKEQFYDMTESILGTTMFDSQVPSFKHQKKLRMTMINGNEPMKKHVQSFNKHSACFVQRLQEQVGRGEFDAEKYIELCMADIIHELLGIEASAQSGHPHPFISQITTIFSMFHYRAIRPWLYSDFIFGMTTIGTHLFQAIKEAISCIEKEIHVKRMQLMSQQENHREINANNSYLDYLVNRMINNDQWTVTTIRQETAAVYVGGFETTNGIISFAILMLAMHIDIQEKVRDEINLVVEGENITITELSNLKYLEMVIKETIRLFPVGPIMPRSVTEDLELTTCTIPRGVSVFLLAYATHRDPKYWVKPEEFIPERFLPENSGVRHPCAYVPFGVGLVSCPGSKFGTMCTKAILAHLIRNYRLRTSMTLDALPLYIHSSVRSVKGCPITIAKI